MIKGDTRCLDYTSYVCTLWVLKGFPRNYLGTPSRKNRFIWTLGLASFAGEAQKRAKTWSNRVDALWPSDSDMQQPITGACSGQAPFLHNKCPKIHARCNALV